jgi:phosphoglycerate dehydrogenase-like enzyme
MQRRLPRYWESQQRGEWDMDANALDPERLALAPPDLDGAAVLIVGHGSIGRAVETRLAPFGCRVVGVAAHARERVHGVESLPALVPEADVVVVLAPLTEATRGIIDAQLLAAMRPGVLLVNAARGGLIDQDALERELRAGRLRAALDVTTPEPLPAGHSLWTAPNLMITPHTAGGTRRWMERAYRFAGDQLRRYVAGEPLLNVRTEY